jgi:adenylate cyclase
MSATNTPDPHGKPPDRRKLIAIVHADMVGYSRLIGLDDVDTLNRLRALRRDVIDPAIEEHGGRLVSTGGDSLLIVFDSIDGAVRCAVTVQRQVPVLEAEQPPDRAIRFRVGINLGDAIPDGSDLHGDAINVAARLQAECPSGCICVSRSVHDHVHERLGLVFEELGPLNLKNIARPIEAWLVRLSDALPVQMPLDQLMSTASETLPVPDVPSIAVLPFMNMSGDPEQEYFSDGIADDIITELSHYHTLFVIARSSSFTYRGRFIDVRRVGRELGVRYVVEGSVRRDAKEARVTVQLVDATTGNHIWAERYDREVDRVLAVQSEIADSVAVTILQAISDAERQRIIRRPPNNLSAWEMYQRGMWHFFKQTPADNERSRALFCKSLEIDPNFLSPHRRLSRCPRLV